MRGPTLKFWELERDDLRYAIPTYGFAIGAIISFSIFIYLLIGMIK